MCFAWSALRVPFLSTCGYLLWWHHDMESSAQARCVPIVRRDGAGFVGLGRCWGLLHGPLPNNGLTVRLQMVGRHWSLSTTGIVCLGTCTSGSAGDPGDLPLKVQGSITPRAARKLRSGSLNLPKEHHLSPPSGEELVSSGVTYATTLRRETGMGQRVTGIGGCHGPPSYRPSLAQALPCLST